MTTKTARRAPFAKRCATCAACSARAQGRARGAEAAGEGALHARRPGRGAAREPAAAGGRSAARHRRRTELPPPAHFRSGADPSCDAAHYVVDAEIDLHGMTGAEAKAALREFIAECVAAAAALRARHARQGPSLRPARPGAEERRQPLAAARGRRPRVRLGARRRRRQRRDLRAAAHANVTRIDSSSLSGVRAAANAFSISSCSTAVANAPRRKRKRSCTTSALDRPLESRRRECAAHDAPAPAQPRSARARATSCRAPTSRFERCDGARAQVRARPTAGRSDGCRARAQRSSSAASMASATKMLPLPSRLTISPGSSRFQVPSRTRCASTALKIAERAADNAKPRCQRSAARRRPRTTRAPCAGCARRARSAAGRSSSARLPSAMARSRCSSTVAVAAERRAARSRNRCPSARRA